MLTLLLKRVKISDVREYCCYFSLFVPSVSQGSFVCISRFYVKTSRKRTGNQFNRLITDLSLRDTYLLTTDDKHDLSLDSRVETENPIFVPTVLFFIAQESQFMF